ncbi:CdaR family transcriptional regulator [Rhodococcus rhodochrous]|uniref:helix-turn-helix domain-containing protein n=1 Tax=Rhodococcus rhodochrous TaxID=1829 RepID=UPI0007516365|nr:helix-turn-helix domain-containing protein [Rhodococcus rhodochrous]MDO1484635.1 helix-turn-helix domain-containing protein [Rhodococcus rhodochrous]SNV27194.1 CdaR family transcriptional regulator [Rhodococcus rhodochrous]
MSISHDGYADLVRAAGAKHPISAILSCLADNGTAWSALLTTSGRLIESVAGKTVDAVDPGVLKGSVEVIPRPLVRPATGVGPDDRELLAFPVGAEGRATAILLMAGDGPVHADLHRFGASAALLLRLLLRDTRRMQTVSRTVRDSVARLVFAGRIDSALELAAEMGLAAPPRRPHIVCVRGVDDWSRDDLLDLFEAALPPGAQQLLAYNDDDECWMLLNGMQFQALGPELFALVDRNPALRVLLTEQVPIRKLSHRWQHWMADIRKAPAGTVVDRSDYSGDTASDWVHKLQRESSPQVVDAVVEYLRHRGRWETAAETLSIHRNTLRYRVSSAEKLLGFELSDPTFAARLWLALRAEGIAD